GSSWSARAAVSLVVLGLAAAGLLAGPASADPPGPPSPPGPGAESRAAVPPGQDPPGLGDKKVVYPTAEFARGRPHEAQSAGGASGSGLLLSHGGTNGIAVNTASPRVYVVFWGSQWGSSSTDANGYLSLSGDASGVAPRLQAMYKGIGTNNETWSGVM